MKLRKVLWSAGVAALPVNVLALGLGNAQLSSALNERLKARIELYSVQNTAPEDIKAGLAPIGDFQKAGLEWTHNLSGLRFRVQTGADGKPYISVTSQDPVREPFLNFLLEVNWPAGRLLREYTVLLDPPVYGAAMKKTVEPTVTSEPEADQRTVVGVPPPVPRTVASARARGAERAPIVVSEGQYGPVRRNDTLWSIASAVRPDAGVSVQQTMLALVEANPEAFVNDNVNALREGHVLRIPEREKMTARSQREALAEVKRQYEVWQQQRLGTTPAMAPVGETGTARGVPPADAEDSRLKLVSPGSGERGAGAGGDAALQESLVLAEEELDSTKAANAELKSRLAETEAMLEDFQRLLELKNENIAELQRRLRQEQYDTGAAAPATEGPAMEQEPAMEMAAGDEPPAVPDEPVEDPFAGVEEAAEMPVEEMLEGMIGGGGPGEAGEPAMEEPSGAMPEPAPPAEEPAGAAPPKPVKKAPILPPPAAPEPAGLLDSLPVSPAILGAGLGGILLLALGGLFLRKKRAGTAADELAAESASLEPATPRPAAPAVEAPPARHDESADATAEFAAEPAPEPAMEERTAPEAFNDTLVQEAAGREDDALDEVNVYLAYERYDQAEQLVRKALEAHPEREAYHLKLLEIHHTAKNVEGFRKDAVALRDLAGEDSAAMKQAQAWWDELAPGKPLFGGVEEEEAPRGSAAAGAAGGAAAGAVAGVAAGEALDFDLTGDEGDQQAAEDAAAGGEAAGEPGDMDLDFDLGLGEDDHQADAEGRAEGDLDLELEGGEDEQARAAAAGGDDLDLEFDLGEGEGEEGGIDFDLGEDESGTADADTEGGLDFDLSEGEDESGDEEGGLDFDLSEGTGGEAESPAASAEDTEDLDFGFGETAEQEAAERTTGELEPAADEDESGMDLEPGGAEEAAEETPTLEEEQPQHAERLDTVALDDLDMDLDSGEEQAGTKAEGGGVDLDLGAEAGGASEAEAEAAAEGEADSGGLDLDFSDFDESAEAVEAPVTGDETEQGSGDDEGPEIDFDLDLGFDEDEEPARTLSLGQEMEGDIDEVGTKLDLAQAYIDMGNADGARTILNEVLSEGDDTQKSEAQQLLDKLG